ncbi:nitric oxide synthase oxygenase [Spirosoma utsteinense]|uniref:nitric oxide synthase oxygenase n=1 Tax=Spirosoma utsteinense TaxID=2585773 RepID=UPI0016456C97|nr:nitric oxide synthase oxygenase [Spirosoma utsteinense]MBC3786961.1 sulfite reductase alpha subunit-like flavoprotein/nitric oxide synthase oxygenase domain/subunit [Spirosoma utsteinense]
MIPPISPTSTPPDSRTVSISDVVALHYPETGYDYRGLIQAYDLSGNLLSEHALPGRRKPEWLVNVRQSGQGQLQLVLQYRVYDAQRWQDAGSVQMYPEAYLDGQSSTVVDLPVTGWPEAPDLQLQIRLSIAQTPQPAASGCPFFAGRTTPELPTRPADAPVGIETDVTDGLAPLTKPEQVLVKDTWNKFLAYQDMLVELFFERLLHEETDLPACFGDAIDLVPGYFAGLFDLSVRQLLPHTERVLRESYRGIYPTQLQGPETVVEFATLLADLGMRPHHWVTARRVWMWVLGHVPHLEEYDRENLDKGTLSAAYRFFTLYILPPALSAIDRYDTALTPAMISEMRRGGEWLTDDALATGIDFYRLLFQTHPEIIPYFGRADVDELATHLMQTIGFLIRSLEKGRDMSYELRELARIHAAANVPADAYVKINGPLLSVMKQRIPDFSSEQEHAWGVLLERVSNVLRQPVLNQHRILGQASEFLRLVAEEMAWEPANYERRWNEIEREVRSTGTYTHTYEELAYGAQVAWRNASKCIGRIAWRNMIVRDLRHVTDPDAMFRECAEHLRLATNGGNLQIVMNVFRPKKPKERWGPRIWNGQYIRFAAYQQEDGTILGDKANVDLTQALMRQGWIPPVRKTAFDCLPLVIDVPGQAPRMYRFDADDVLTVPLEHPAYPAFAALDLKWCAIPAISNFRMNIGGVQYGCIPFNGWFMETEIARNIWEEGRYGKAEDVARAMGIDTSSEQTLWRDRAFLELNVAVLHSFTKAKVTLVDHQTASRQFLVHDQREKRAGRECPAQWSWVTPSAGGSSTPAWHHEMRDFYLSPSYHYAADKWMVVDTDMVLAGENGAAETSSETGRILILYGSETGTAESYARQTARRLNQHHPLVMTLNEYDTTKLDQERVVLVVTSTFGNGELPSNAMKFLARLKQLPDGTLSRLHFSVMALGSTIYPHFCAAGATVDRELARVGGNRMVDMHQGDEIKGQADTFHQWLDLVARLLGEDPTSTDGSQSNAARLTVSFLDGGQRPALVHELPRRRLSGVDVPIVANRELLKEVIVGSRSTRFLAFDIAGTDLIYETGDHVAIYPKNSPALVQHLCDRLGIDIDGWFTTALVDQAGNAVEGEHAYPQPVSVWQVLTEDLDLTLREPVNELITALLGTASDPVDREQLDVWTELLSRGEEDAACQTLKKFITDTFVTIVDLLDAFPSASLSFVQVIDLLPSQKPRLYSISSCSLVYPTEIHVTVGVVQITTDAGQTRPGLCSNYLAGLVPGEATVWVAVRTSNFRPPLDPQAPMLLVGPGTGLSPLVGFLQHREVQLRALRDAQHHSARGYGTPAGGETSPKPLQLGQARLYFGCRNLNDYLYQQELENWRDAGVLTHLDVAFSRLGEQTVYVQHLIGQQSQDMWEVLLQPDCHYYVCGDAKMADDVFAVLMNIAKTVGGLSHAEAVDFFRKMRHENRFVMDVWGVLLNYREALAELQDAHYSQGERWLEQVTS